MRAPSRTAIRRLAGEIDDTLPLDREILRAMRDGRTCWASDIHFGLLEGREPAECVDAALTRLSARGWLRSVMGIHGFWQVPKPVREALALFSSEVK